MKTQAITITASLLLLLMLTAAHAAPASTSNSNPATSAGQPRLILLHADRLAGAKARLARQDPALQSALQRLLGRAEGALKLQPASVMDKKRMPPSGDKHDYTSYARYFWPDPKKKDGLPYIMRDGHPNPEFRVDSDGERMSRMATSVPALAQAWYFTGDEKYAAQAARLLRTWFLDPATRMNPNLNYAQGVPGRYTGTAWGLVDTVILLQLPDAVTLLAGSKNWPEQDMQGMRRWFGDFAQWMLTSKNGIEEGKAKNNHGTFYDAQVITYALFAGKPELARPVAEAAGKRRIAAQIEPDGRQPGELWRADSFGYSLYNLEAFFTLAAACQAAGVDLWHYASPDGRSLRKALEFLIPYAEGKQKWTWQQIDGVNGRGLVSYLLKAADVYGEPAYAAAARRLAGDRPAGGRDALLENRP